MQNRRQFLCTAIQAATGASVTLLLTPLVGCSNNDNNNNVPAPAPVATTNPTTPGCDGAGSTSTFTLDHNHTICVPLADINTPPTLGMTYTTSTASTDGHTHQVSLSAAQLGQLALLQTIVVTTTVVESHTHDFSLVENGTTTTAPAPVPTAPTTSGGY